MSFRDSIYRPCDAEDTDRMEVVLVRMSDEARLVCLPSWKPYYTWEDACWWLDGNQSCPGNRREEWARITDTDSPPEHSCSNPEHYVILRSP